MSLSPRDTERRFAIAAALLLPWAMLLVTDWTVTPIGMVDAWIYRALGRDLVHANASLSDYYYVARPFVLMPRYFLSHFLLEGIAHAAYALICANVLLFAVLDLLTSVANPGTRFVGVLLFGTCIQLLRSIGWGYIDGSLISWFMVGLAGVARWYRPQSSARSQLLSALVAGGCFAAMLSTHPMTLPMLLTPLGLIVWLQKQTKQTPSRLLWLQLTLGGLGAVVLMGVVSQLLLGRLLYFMPIVQAARGISTADWKQPLSLWLPDANWLVLLLFAWLVAASLLATAKARRVQLTSFEGFASLNVIGLMTVMLGLEAFTSGYWLEYPYFASYFLPAALLALAATLGERVKATSTPRVLAGLTAVFVIGVGLAHHFESAWVVPSFDARYFPFRAATELFGVVPLIQVQIGVAVVALLGLLTWRSLVRRPAGRPMLTAGALVAVVIGGPINHIAPGDATESQAAAAVAQATLVIQDELQGRRPVYWYNAKDPLARLFVTISSAHLAYFSHLRQEYPQGAQSLRSTGHGSVGIFQTGDPVVIFDDTPNRFPWAQHSFSELGITLKETRRVHLVAGASDYWLIFATLEPNAAVLQPADLPTTLKASVLVNGERISERERGFLSFGPYVPLVAGAWRITFHLRLLDQPAGNTLGTVDVGDVSGKTPVVFQSAPLLASSARENGELDTSLEFTLKDRTPRAEFRVSTDGNSRLALHSVEVQRLDAPLAQPTVLERPVPAPGVDAGSAADADFLKSLYRDLLGREPDPAGFAANLSALARGMSREQIRQGFLESPEYTARKAAPPGR